MIDPKKLKKISKSLSLILRHHPETIGLELDEAGWADIAQLLERLARSGRSLSRSELDEVVAKNDKQRYAISEDGLRIRANQGHTIDIDLGLTPCEPPDVLYHGTARHAVDAIMATGLNRGWRHHVHLSDNPTTARAVGGRHGVPVILRIDAGAMHADGHEFFRSENGVWLVDEVPTPYLELLNEDRPR